MGARSNREERRHRTAEMCGGSLLYAIRLDISQRVINRQYGFFLFGPTRLTCLSIPYRRPYPEESFGKRTMRQRVEDLAPSPTRGAPRPSDRSRLRVVRERGMPRQQRRTARR